MAHFVEAGLAAVIDYDAGGDIAATVFFRRIVLGKIKTFSSRLYAKVFRPFGKTFMMEELPVVTPIKYMVDSERG